MSFSIGTIVAGKYRVERVLGQGGMGTVFLATHILLDRPVALKILNARAFEHPAATERLLREGRALARLRGEHIARVLDVEAPGLVAGLGKRQLDAVYQRDRLRVGGALHGQAGVDVDRVSRRRSAAGGAVRG